MTVIQKQRVSVDQAIDKLSVVRNIPRHSYVIYSDDGPHVCYKALGLHAFLFPSDALITVKERSS